MGLFDSVQDNLQVSTMREDDRTGRYIQRITKINTIKTRNHGEALRFAKETIKVLDDPEGRAQVAGADTTQTIFQGDFLTRDMKLACKCLMGLNAEEADKLTGKKMQKELLNGSLHGVVFEIECKEETSQKGKAYTKTKWVRSLDADALAEILTEDEIKQFFPKGLS